MENLEPGYYFIKHTEDSDWEIFRFDGEFFHDTFSSVCWEIKDFYKIKPNKLEMLEV